MEPSKTGTDVYRSRNPRASDYFRSVEAHFEELEGVWPPARRAYGSERMIAMQTGTVFGDPIRWM